MDDLTIEELSALISVNLNDLENLYYKDAIKRTEKIEHYAALLAKLTKKAAQAWEEDFKPSFLESLGSSE